MEVKKWQRFKQLQDRDGPRTLVTLIMIHFKVTKQNYKLSTTVVIFLLLYCNEIAKLVHFKIYVRAGLTCVK